MTAKWSDFVSARVRFREFVNEARSVSRFLASSRLEEAFEKASKEDKEALLAYLVVQDLKRTRQWINQILNRHELLELETTRRLRILAQRRHIGNYTRLNRGQLIQELEKCYEQERIAVRGS